MAEIHERVGEAAATLVCGPAGEGPTGTVCRDLLTAGIRADRDPLVVSYDRSPADCVAPVDAADAESVRPAVVLVGDGADADEGDHDVASVQTVATPGDLTALGIALSRRVAAADGAVTICFDSVTALLDHVAEETAYEFFHALTGQLYDAGARAHFHLDAADHDETTVATFASVCDALVTAEDDPGVRVRPSAQ